MTYNNKILKNCPLNILETYKLGSLVYYYEDLKNTYQNSKSATRNRTLPLPKIKMNTLKNFSNIVAIKMYNDQDTTSKILDTADTKKLKRILKNEIYNSGSKST